MNPVILRRFAILFFSLLILALLFFGINLARFSPSQWLAERTSAEVSEQLLSQATESVLGTQLKWKNVELEWSGYEFSAEQLSADFNLLSVLIGKPNLSNVTMVGPYFSMPNDAFDINKLRPLIGFGFQQLNVTEGLFVVDELELQDIELSMLRNGVFGEYALQLSSELNQQDLTSRFSYSTLIGVDGEDKLVLGKNQFDANIVFQNWSGRIAGKVKSLYIGESLDVQVKFANWSSSWKTSSDITPYTLDWAGGLTSGRYEESEWTFSTIDTAIAYIDAQNTAHTFAVQSNEAKLKGNDLTGQLGLSLLTEYPEGQDWKSYNVVMSGTMTPNKSIFEWKEPDIRISMIDADNLQQTHYIKVRSADLINNRLTLTDGEWSLIKEDIPSGDFGFGKISSEWPSLDINEAPNVATRIQPAFNLISEDVEYLDALFKHLVP